MKSSDSASTSTGSVETDDHQGPSSGALTPAVSNVSHTHSATVEEKMTVERGLSTSWLQEHPREDDDEQEPSLADSWEAIEVDIEQGQGSTEEPEEIHVPQPLIIVSREKMPPLVYKPSVLKTKKKTAPKLFLFVFCAAMLFGLMAATGLLPQQQKPVQKKTLKPWKEPKNQTIPSTASSHSASTRTAATPKKEYQNDSTNFGWLSLDDDVLAGQIFWENETTLDAPQPKKNAPFLFKPLGRSLMSTKDVSSTASQNQRNKSPLNWIARHYQRLNVYVLGQSQLAQLKRRQKVW